VTGSAADHAQFHPRAGQQPDQPFLRGVDVLVLIHDQVRQRGVHAGRHLRLVQLGHGAGDQLPVGQQPELLE
jgi:hypothetical protein